jgi:dihydroorotate dehydrogenase electron transfer subunit
MKQTLCYIASNVEVMPGVYVMWIEAPHVAAAAQPGQFLTVRCKDFILRRPFSIHQVGNNNVIAGPDAIGTKQSQVAILFRVAGKGTLWLSRRQAGEKIDILGPLGKGFTIRPESKNLLLVAGGIGIAPLVLMMQQVSPHHQVTLIQGASTAAQLYLGSRQLTAISHQRVQVVPVTEDGSMGQKGMATDILPDFLDRADQVHACGPVDMYKTMAEMSLRAKKSSLKLEKCQVSLEVRMGCGFGACYGCTINTRKGLKRVCRDGPVFELGDIIWQEVKI